MGQVLNYQFLIFQDLTPLAETARVLTLPDVKSRLDATGMVSKSSTPEELKNHIYEEIAKWAKVVRALDLRVE